MTSEFAVIAKVSSWDSGGGVLIDLVELNDGRILGITEEIMILYDNMEDIVSGDPMKERPTLYL